MKSDSKAIMALILVLATVGYYWVVFSSNIIFGDEGFYAAEGRWIAKNGIYPIYDNIHGSDAIFFPMNKPPMYILINTALWSLGGELLIKVFIPLFAFLSSIFLYLIFRSYNQEVLGLISAAVFLMINAVITYGVLNYVESLLVMFFIAALYFGLHAIKKSSKVLGVISGIFSGLALMTDISGIFVPILIVIIWFFILKFKNKNLLLTILVTTIVVSSSFFLRNIYFYGNLCYPIPIIDVSCEPVYAVDFNQFSKEGLEFIGGEAEIGTGARIMQMGFFNYFNFSIGIILFIFLLFGIAFYIPNKKEEISFLFAPWLFIFFLITVYFSIYGGRAEDIPRYTLFGYPAVSATIALFLGGVYDFVKRKTKILAILLVVILLVPVLPTAHSKLLTMKNVKSFVPGFFEGCDWIKMNTPEDSLIYTIYAHHTSYACNRKTFSSVPDQEIIQLAADNRSYEHLKLHGADYVYVQYFTVGEQPYRETTPVAFLQYMDSSPNFEKVFDNTNTYGRAGVILYKIL